MATKAQRKEAALNGLKAVSHELRAKILRILTERKASPIEMSRELGEPVDKVNYHTKKLVKWGCAKEVGNRQVRGAVEHFYRATIPHMVGTGEWERLHPELGRGFLSDIVEKMVEDLVASLKADLMGKDENFHLSRTRLLLDEEGQGEVLEIQERARKEIERAQELSAGRMAEEATEGIHHSSLLACFEVPPG